MKDGGPAFPMPGQKYSDGKETWQMNHAGMSLRDYFAAAALTGLMANRDMRPGNDDELAHAARKLYQFADAMLAEREKK